MRDNKVIQALAVAATLCAVATMGYVERGGFAPRVNSELHLAVGRELARQAVSRLKPGGQILVITRDTAAFPNPATDLLMEGCRRELRKLHTDISEVQTLQLDPLRLVEVPPEDFQRWIHHANGGDVIISFLGPPVLTAAQLQGLGEIKPAIVAFCPGSSPDTRDFRPLFADGLLNAAIVSRRDQPPVPVTPRVVWRRSPDSLPTTVQR